jgi:hypothetical protein
MPEIYVYDQWRLVAKISGGSAVPGGAAVPQCLYVSHHCLWHSAILTSSHCCQVAHLWTGGAHFSSCSECYEDRLGFVGLDRNKKKRMTDKYVEFVSTVRFTSSVKCLIILGFRAIWTCVLDQHQSSEPIQLSNQHLRYLQEDLTSDLEVPQTCLISMES